LPPPIGYGIFVVVLILGHSSFARFIVLKVLSAVPQPPLVSKFAAPPDSVSSAPKNTREGFPKKTIPFQSIYFSPTWSQSSALFPPSPIRLFSPQTFSSITSPVVWPPPLLRRWTLSWCILLLYFVSHKSPINPLLFLVLFVTNLFTGVHGIGPALYLFFE